MFPPAIQEFPSSTFWVRITCAVFLPWCTDQSIVHYLRSSFFRSVFDDSNSTAINQLTQDMLKRAIVPLPPLSEQRRIVEAIGAMLFELNQIEKSLS